MKQSFFIILSICFTCFSLRAQTYYYKQVKIVDASRQQRKGDGTGQFVMFTNKGCYDCDHKGFDVGNGFLKLLKDTEDIHVYYGNSYWGTAYYYVASDKSRINIKVERTGETLVYQRETAPSDARTSAHIASQASSGGTVAVPVPVWVPENGEAVSSSSSGSTLIRETCSFCKGTGRSPVKNYATDYTGGERVTVQYCSICGRYDKMHTHGTCESCRGRGYTERYR